MNGKESVRLFERTAIDEELEELVRALFNDDEIDLEDDTAWSEIPGWDSLSHVNLVVSVEETFAVEFDEEELGTFTTVGALKKGLERRIGD
jgi:acyl carrier protein